MKSIISIILPKYHKYERGLISVKREQVQVAKSKTLEYFKKAGIILTEEEKSNIEVTDFGLGELETTGLELITYVNTNRCCAKELILFPYSFLRQDAVHGCFSTSIKKPDGLHRIRKGCPVCNVLATIF